jgi:hypothetical protein
MDELLMCTGAVLLVIGVTYCFTLLAIVKAKKTITAKQDAIMAKLIEIKPR